MPAIIRSLLNVAQTLDSAVLPAYATQTRAGSTSALVAAAAAKQIQMDIIDDPAKAVVDLKKIYSYTPATGATVSAPDDAEVVTLEHSSTIAELTLNMPANPYDGQELELATRSIITALTMAATGKTLRGGLTAGVANGYAKWKYRASDTTWIRLG